MHYESILETVGETPLVKLQRLTGNLPFTILAKLEFFNPGGSIKDRMAIYMIEDAVKRGHLKPGGTIVENTSGNTGIGLAMYAAVHGYKAIFTIPGKMSKEKINLLKAFGADVIICPFNIPADSPQSYYETAKRVAKETPNSFFVNQYHNPKNIDAHYEMTGPELWKQTKGVIDYFVAGIGTGGTISGVGKYLKEQNPQISVIAVDPFGSIYYDFYQNGRMVEPYPYLVEGIGEDMICTTMDFEIIDDIIQVSDRDAFLMARRLVKEEGIFAGGSSGAAICAALEIGKRISRNKTIVTILPDTGFNYLSKIFNDDWMKEKGFM